VWVGRLFALPRCKLLLLAKDVFLLIQHISMLEFVFASRLLNELACKFGLDAHNEYECHGVEKIRST
jgi:hypothetical protein